MTELSPERLEEMLTEMRGVFSDGFQFSDVPMLVKTATEFAELLDASGTEKKAAALMLMERFLDEVPLDAIADAVRKIDLPGPTWLEDNVLDPLLLEYVVPLIKDSIKSHLPAFVDLLVDATKGDLKINQPPVA